MKIVFALLVAAYVVVLNEADPTECWHCTLLDLNNCNPPLKTERARHQSCASVPHTKNTTSKTLCYRVSSTWLGLHVSYRGCLYAEMENQDLCTYLHRTEASGPFMSNFSCTTCDKDNCNYD